MLTLNYCKNDGHIEISSMTPTKIEGIEDTFAPGAKFNCQKCASAEPLKEQPFTWIPADE